MTTTATRISKPFHASVPKTQALIGALLLTASALVGGARADVPLPAPTIPVSLPVPTSANVPFFSTVSAAFSPGGVLYVWDGVDVLQQQNGLSGNSFQAIGSVPGSNGADPGPIAFSNDGSQIWLGNGGGQPRRQLQWHDLQRPRRRGHHVRARRNGPLARFVSVESRRQQSDVRRLRRSRARQFLSRYQRRFDLQRNDRRARP